MTNMKRTLARAPEAFGALMSWYPLYDVVSGFLGKRTTVIFCHAISAQTDCLICETYFRKILIEWGENPNELSLDEWENTLVGLGRQIANEPSCVSEEQFEKLRRKLTDEQVVSLFAFAAMMVATNVFNHAMGVELDEALEKYRGK